MYTVDEVAFRVKAYIEMFERALSDLKVLNTDSKVDEVLNMAKLYLADSKHYFSLGDYITSLSCIAYAEGLLDSLRLLGFIDVKWVREKPKKVLVGGTFDLLHVGHIHYLSEASKKGLVYAVVATDANVRRIKGRDPILPQNARLALISSIKYVYKALLGDEKDFLKPVEEVKPDIILLGPDQPIDEGFIVKELDKKGLRVSVERLRKRINDDGLSSSSEIIKEIIRRYCLSSSETQP